MKIFWKKKLNRNLVLLHKWIYKSSLKKNSTGSRLVVSLFLVVSLIFLSAFTSVPKDYKRFTRYEMAMAAECILDSCRVLVQPNHLQKFSDLSDDQTFAIYRTLSSGIMKGFTDKTFRPDESLKNIETLGYLQNIFSFLKENGISSHASRQLLRIMAYKSDSEALFTRSIYVNRLSSENYHDSTDRNKIYEIVKIITGQINALEIILEGQIINAVSGRPIASARVASDKKAVTVDKNGNFKIFHSKNTKKVTIFAAAEGFQSIEVKKDLGFSRKIKFRLNPATSSLID